MANKAFTIRLPKSVLQQIDERTKFSRRSRNSEILVLIERALDIPGEAVAQQMAQVKAAAARETSAPE
jgi:hypothetical protein